MSVQQHHPGLCADRVVCRISVLCVACLYFFLLFVLVTATLLSLLLKMIITSFFVFFFKEKIIIKGFMAKEEKCWRVSAAGYTLTRC